MDNIRLFLSLPFQRDGNAADYPDCVKQFRARELDRYLQALRAEIVSAAEGLEDCLVTELECGVGSFCHIPSDELEALFDLVRRHYRLSPHAAVSLRAAPSGFDFYRLTAAKHLNEARIDFLTPCLDDDRLAELGFCKAEAILNALDVCFQAGYHRFTCLLSPRCHSIAEELGASAASLAQKKPGAIRFDAPLTPEEREAVASALGGSYHPDGDAWLREGFSLARDESLDQIGCGLAAVSKAGETLVKATADFDFYCEHSTEFELLIEHDKA